jgi:hypothetical protein
VGMGGEDLEPKPIRILLVNQSIERTSERGPVAEQVRVGGRSESGSACVLHGWKNFNNSAIYTRRNITHMIHSPLKTIASIDLASSLEESGRSAYI